MKKLFFDTEFTGLHRMTTLISIGIIADDGRAFYAELNDYDMNQCDHWIKQNVIPNLRFLSPPKGEDEHWSATRTKNNPVGNSLYDSYSLEMRGSMKDVKTALFDWLNQFEETELQMWSDCYAYDWMLFCEMWGGAIMVPDWINYIPMDLSTALFMKGHDPDVSREDFCEVKASAADKHNAMWDANIIKACCNKLGIS